MSAMPAATKIAAIPKSEFPEDPGFVCRRVVGRTVAQTGYRNEIGTRASGQKDLLAGCLLHRLCARRSSSSKQLGREFWSCQFRKIHPWVVPQRSACAVAAASMTKDSSRSARCVQSEWSKETVTMFSRRSQSVLRELSRWVPLPPLASPALCWVDLSREVPQDHLRGGESVRCALHERFMSNACITRQLLQTVANGKACSTSRKIVERLKSPFGPHPRTRGGSAAVLLLSR